MSTAGRERFASILLFGLLFLFFSQLLTDFVAAVYAFGLLGQGIPAEIALVVLCLSPLLLIPLRRDPPAAVIFALGKLLLLARLVEMMLPTRERMFMSGLGVACFLLLLPALLWQQGRVGKRQIGSEIGAGLLLAVALAALLRTLGSGQDLSLHGWFQLLSIALISLAGALWVLVIPVFDDCPPAAHGDTSRLSASGLGRLIALSLGLSAVLVLLYYVFTAPHVLARWTGVDYRFILPAASLALAGYALLVLRPGLVQRWHPVWLRVGVLVFALALGLTALGHQMPFPADPAAYPLAEPAAPWWSHLALAAALLAFPLLFAAAAVLAQGLAVQVHEGANLRQLGVAFGVAALFLVIAIFAQVFTTVYDYIPVVGPLFRDKFWLVHLVPGLVAFLALLAVPSPPGAVRLRAFTSLRVLAIRLLAVPSSQGAIRLHLPARPARQVAGLTVALAALAIAGLFLVTARPPAAPAPRQTIRVLTYNVQQGYSAAGQHNLAGQLDLVRGLAPDLIGLQESDTARIANGNGDLVRLFADRLHMHAYYGPKTGTGTFGIALLSRYPIHNPRTVYLFSEGEQVAALAADIRVGDQTFAVFVTHLGNGGPRIQQEQFLQFIGDSTHVIALGDFNFDPSSEQYRLTTATLADAWTARWPDGVDDAGLRPARKIDHIFVSPDMRVLDARFIDDPASDHPAVTATLGP